MVTTMFTEYNQQVTSPGAFEGESPMVAYLAEHPEYADEESGDVESPTGFFARHGKWILTYSSQGFIYGEKMTTLDEAISAFETLDEEFSIWDGDETEGW
jgi:hypothetical protein